MVLGSSHPLTEMRTRSISWGKGGRYVRLTILPPSCAAVMKSVKLNLLEPSGPLQACNWTALPLVVFNSLGRVTSLPLGANGRRRLGQRLERQLYDVEPGLSRPNW